LMSYTSNRATTAYETQVGGDHYKKYKIQPSAFVNQNKILFAEGNAIKYICRAGYKDDKYIQDLTKAIHYLQNELLHAAGGGIPPQNGTRQQPVQPTYTTDFDR